VLFMPASNARALAKARTLDADALILDLEDAVAPHAKHEARQQAAAALAEGGFGHRERVLRVNPLDTTWAADDLAAAAVMALDAVLLPKVESAATVAAAWQHLQRGGAPTDLPVWIMIETPRGLLEANTICAHSPQVRCLVMGTSDLAKALRVPQTPGRPGLLGALSHCVAVARAHGLDVLDGVQLDLEDDAALEAVCAQARDMGFDGKTLIHPRQIAAANRAFAPDPDAVAAASRVVEAWRKASADGAGLAVVDGRLVEHLHAEEAQRVLALAKSIQQSRQQ
jgi:citrate lyase subunit beta/citryl-CoA lyase